MSDVDRIAGWLAERARLESTASLSLLRRSLKCYEGTSLFESVGGRVHRGEYGECLVIEQVIPCSLPIPSPATAEEALLSELRLLFGVGHARERQLREEGYTSIGALLGHPRWGKAAQTLLQDWGQPLNPERVRATISHWFPASHSLFRQLLGLVQREGILFFDLETLGLGGTPIILVALARLAKANIQITQYLARSLDEEITLLEQVNQELSNAALLISYNGKSFDWPYLRERSAYYGLRSNQEAICHIDLLHHSRSAFRDRLPDMRLGTVERLLGVEREEDLPSEAVPDFYSAYLETGNPGPLVPIVNHNRQDVESLAILLARLLDSGDDA